MPKYIHPNALDGGLSFLKANINKMGLVAAYAVTDTYATVNAALLADVPMATTDLIISASGLDQIITTASGKQDAAANASGGGAGNHLVFLDTVGLRILMATPETSGQAVVLNNPVIFPSIVHTSKQPV